jgi:hypothetical protein
MFSSYFKIVKFQPMKNLPDSVNVDAFIEQLKSVIKHVVTECLQQHQKEESLNGFLSREETAKRLRVTLPTLHKWIDKKVLNPYYMESKPYFREEEIIATLRAGYKNKTSDRTNSLNPKKN